MKILMISTTFPYPPTRGATQVRTFNLLKYLSKRHAITLVTQRSEEITDIEVEKLQQWVEELVMFPQPQPSEQEKGIKDKLQRWSTILQQGTPQKVLQLYSTPMQQWLDQAVEAGQFDLITCEHSTNEIYVRPEWREQLRTVVNIHHSVYRKSLDKLETKTSDNQLKDQLNLPLLRRYEEQYCAKFTDIVVTTAEDRRQIESFELDSKITLISNGVDVNLFPRRISDPGGHRLVFTGAMDNPLNIKAARYFSLEVFPAITERYADTKLELVGPKPVQAVLDLEEIQGISVTGAVPSLVDHLHKATIFVVPMQSGFGVKNKTLEAMAAGVPVVGSDRGLEGLTVDGGDVPLRALRANDTTEYVYGISRLFEDRQLRKQLSENGRGYIEQKYTWERAGELYEQVITS